MDYYTGKEIRVKRKLKFIIFSIALIVCICGILIFKLGKSSLPIIYPIEDIEIKSVEDGEYIGYVNNSLIKVKLAVSVLNGEIREIEILQHDNGLGKKAESIIADIIKNQSLKVDAVSSATYSSNSILKAIENALINSSREVEKK